MSPPARLEGPRSPLTTALHVCLQIQKQLDDGASPIPSDYDGPRLDDDARPTPAFVDDMVAHFKAGKLLPKRIVWQILLGAYNVLKEEETLVDVPIPEGQTVDVCVSPRFHPAELFD